MQQEIWLAIRTDGAPGAGTESDPFNCAGTVMDADPAFDKVMRKLSASVIVRLQPGT